MEELRFDGRVAVVTGAGRGIGRAHAMLLAERGAKVVVNDLGGSMEGDGADAGPASSVAGEISDAGGNAVSDTSDVADPVGAQTLIDTALENFGRLDILVNNAGIIRWARFADTDLDNLERHLAVHVVGSFNTARAAWTQMVDRGYGRIVMTTSTGVFGLPANTSYATAKAAVIGLTRSLATAGASHGIKVNMIAPAAATRMAGGPATTSPEVDEAAEVLSAQMTPEVVAPMLGFLADETCPVTGEIYAAGAGRFARIFIASTEGFVHPGPDVTVEDVARNWSAINDEARYYVPADLMSWTEAFMAHLGRDR